MTALFRNNYVRIGIITLFISLFALILIAPAITSAQATPPAQAGGQANVAPGTTELGISTRIGQFIGNLILGIASMITWIGGMLLEGSIQRFILELGGPRMLGGSIGIVINNLWVVIRDMANLAFIFGFIYIGIMTIIDSSSANTKRMLASIIIGALLINFSLFFTKIIIDVSNYTAVEIYNALIAPPTGGPPGSISARVTDIMGLTTLYKIPTADQYAGVTAGGNVAFYFMGAVMLIVAGFVFAAGAVLLLIRFVALVFIMIFSPLLFAATVFPQTQSTASDLWKKLINYSFFAPAYLILLVVSIKVLEAFAAIFRNPANGAADMLAGRAGAFDVMINFVVAILFLIMSLQIAMKFGVVGANKVMSVGNSLSGKARSAMGRTAGAATFGAGAKLSRATVGRYAHNVSEREGLKDRASRKGVGGFIARQQLKAAKSVGDASFDARNIAGAGKATGLGDGRKGGYTTVKKEVEDKEMKYAKSLGEVEDDDEQVKARKKVMDDAKKALDRDREFLRKEMRDGKDDTAREEARAKLEKLETAHADAQEAHGREKQRRVLGSAAHVENEKSVKDAKAQLDSELDGLKEVQKQAAAATTEAEREMLLGMAKSLQGQVDDAKKNYKTAQKEASKSIGYAGVLQSSRWFNTWPVGRLRSHEHEAGEAIRKAYEKKIKKSKEDQRHDEVVSATKEAKAAPAASDH